MLAGFQALWATGMPWHLVSKAIDNNSFAYEVSDECKAAWVAQTGRAWDSADDSLVKSTACPACNAPIEIPWTTCGLPEAYNGDERPGLIGNGYGDGKLLFMCPSCGIVIDKELLALSKFCKDTESLLARGRPMPGTLLEPKTGTPDVIPASSIQKNMHPRTFPNRILQKVLRIQVIELIKPGMKPNPTMNDVKLMIEAVFADRQKLASVDNLSGMSHYRTNPTARIAVRKMMRSYWENFTPFSHDLGGALMLQGIFYEKMVNID